MTFLQNARPKLQLSTTSPWWSDYVGSNVGERTGLCVQEGMKQCWCKYQPGCNTPGVFSRRNFCLPQSTCHDRTHATALRWKCVPPPKKNSLVRCKQPAPLAERQRVLQSRWGGMSQGVRLKWSTRDDDSVSTHFQVLHYSPMTCYTLSEPYMTNKQQKQFHLNHSIDMCRQSKKSQFFAWQSYRWWTYTLVTKHLVAFTSIIFSCDQIVAATQDDTPRQHKHRGFEILVSRLLY